MNICYFGSFDPQFTRNKVNIKGLKKNNLKVIQCSSSKGWFIFRYLQLVSKFLHLASKIDVIIVGVLGHYDVPLAWILGKIFSKPVVFDAFISLYDTYVFDRQAFTKNSLQAKIYWWIDKISCSLSDIVLLDTREHINYFVREFKLDKRKFKVLPVGADDTVFKPKPKSSSKVIVEFHGMFTRLHGAEYFVQAAKKLENHPRLEFWLIGDSLNYRKPINLYRSLKPKNMKYFKKLSPGQLAKKVASAHITVGHLGSTQKASRVISFKTIQGLACRNAVIALNSPATRQYLVNHHNSILIKSGNSQQLTKAILFLSKHNTFRKKIALRGHQLFRKHFINYQIGQRLISLIKI